MMATIIDTQKMTIEFFDPSYDILLEKMYSNICSTIAPGYTVNIPLKINIQSFTNNLVNADVFCKAWCLQYIHRRLILNMDINAYIDLFQIPIKNNTSQEKVAKIYYNEIKTFILGLIDDKYLVQIGGHEYKYLKYLHKYKNILEGKCAN